MGGRFLIVEGCMFYRCKECSFSGKLIADNAEADNAEEVAVETLFKS